MKFNRKRFVELTAAVLVLLAVLAAAVIVCRNGGRDKEEAGSGRGAAAVEETGAERGTAAEEKAGSGRGTMALDTRAAKAVDADRAPVENPLEGRNVFFAGYEDIYAAPDTPVRLENREENLDFLMRYEIHDAQTGEILFETGLIPSGQHVSWVPGETLDKGVYALDILQIPYLPDPSGEYIGLS